jgi:hypothetical protein
MKGNTTSDSYENQTHFSKMRTSGLLIEYRRPRRALSVDIAAHIATPYTHGKIAVVASHPQALLSSVRKQWVRLIRLAQREQARTLNRRRKDDLGEIIRYMQSISFAAKDSADEPGATISFATVEQPFANPPTCATIYFVESTPKINQYKLTAWMPRGGLVVVYDEQD